MKESADSKYSLYIFLLSRKSIKKGDQKTMYIVFLGKSLD